MKRVLLAVSGLAFGALLGLQIAQPSAFAADKKVPCDQIMAELNGGKKVAEVAKDLDTTEGHVRYCRRKDRMAKMKAAPAGGESTPAMAAPMASPAAAK